MISNKCKYAIKALLYIAEFAEEQRPVLSSEIATNQKIPKKFLESILRELRNNMILSSRRGRAGGYTLLKNPKEIIVALSKQIISKELNQSFLLPLSKNNSKHAIPIAKNAKLV